MTEHTKAPGARRALFAATLLLLGVALGFVLARLPASPGHATVVATPAARPAPPPAPPQRKVLYWYDPMKPEQHFDKPGRSPFMDMDLVPRYAEVDSGAASAGVSIDARVTQNLGLRTVAARRGRLAFAIDALGEFQYNQRDVANVQSRADGFVERVYGLAPGDHIARGAPIVDLMLPSWGSAQQEFLGVLDLGDARLIDAARSRLRLLGMSDSLMARLEATRKSEARVTLVSPLAGVIVDLAVRGGMAVSAGTTLATINGSDPVWLEVAVPERHAAGVRVGAMVRAELAAYPGSVFTGEVANILPAADAATRSVRLRVSFANGDGRLHPGLSARVHIDAAQGDEGVLIPSAALIRGGTHDRVIKVEAGGRYAPVVVHVGREADGEVEVLHGLQAGDMVAAAAQFLLDADASLKGLAPADDAMSGEHMP